MVRRLLTSAIALASVLTPGLAMAKASLPPPSSAADNLPMAAETRVGSAARCAGKLVDASSGPTVLFVVDDFRDGTVKESEGGGPLNDSNDFVMQQALSNFDSKKILVTRRGEPHRMARARLVGTQLAEVFVEGRFNAYDQRVEDRSKSVSGFLFWVNAQYARDFSQNALHLTVQLTQDGLSWGPGFSYKAILQNKGKRYGFGVYTDDADLNLNFARASFQGVGDMERLLIDLAALTVVRRVYGIDVSQCLDAATGDRFGPILERERTGTSHTWYEDGREVTLQILETHENWRGLGRPCRTYAMTFAGDVRNEVRRGLACRVAPNVWTTNPTP